MFGGHSPDYCWAGRPLQFVSTTQFSAQPYATEEGLAHSLEGSHISSAQSALGCVAKTPEGSRIQNIQCIVRVSFFSGRDRAHRHCWI